MHQISLPLGLAAQESEDGENHVGSGVLEQLIFGPHAPSGFKDLMDTAP